MRIQRRALHTLITPRNKGLISHITKEIHPYRTMVSLCGIAIFFNQFATSLQIDLLKGELAKAANDIRKETLDTNHHFETKMQNLETTYCHRSRRRRVECMPTVMHVGEGSK